MSAIERITKAAHLIDMKDIIREGNPTLRAVAEEVSFPLSDQDIILGEKMMQFLKHSQDPVMAEKLGLRGGVGLAAPQIGVSKRVFVCDDGNGVVRKVINPIVVPLTEETQEFEEGCLSVPGIYKKVERPKRVLLKYLNENGEEVEEIAENFLAVVVQHENDHLDGILFVEKISPMAKRLIAKKLANMKKETKRIKEENE